MRVSEYVRCERFPCADVKHECYVVPDVDLEPDGVCIIMIKAHRIHPVKKLVKA